MKIAVVTDDGKTISQHFGRAMYYEVLTLESGGVTGRERREKPAHHGHHHHHPEGETVNLDESSGPWEASTKPQDTHSTMAAPILDCQTVFSRGMGRGAYDSLRAAGIRPSLPMSATSTRPFASISRANWWIIPNGCIEGGGPDECENLRASPQADRQPEVGS